MKQEDIKNEKNAGPNDFICIIDQFYILFQ